MEQKIQQAAAVRYHDLDALRAVAMILGIALHGALSFVAFPWVVQDSEQSALFGDFFTVIHGFRMPVFFVMSGFFTAMLWRRRGLASTLKQRFLRVFLPCMLGIWTIVPLQDWVGGFVSTESPPAWPFEITEKDAKDGKDDGVPITAELERPVSLPLAAKRGDLGQVQDLLADGADPDDRMEDRSSALHWAAVQGYYEIVDALLDADADRNVRSADGGTPLHWTVFLGEHEMVELLLSEGADPNLANDSGQTPLDTISASWEELEEITKWLAGLMQIEVDIQQIKLDRPLVIQALQAAGAEGGKGSSGIEKLIVLLLFKNVFHHLWFLWYLCLFVMAFAFYAVIAKAVGLRHLPKALIVSPLRYLWLLPVTLLPQLVMHGGSVSGFGPDTSTGWLPFPHLLFYYAIFFFFGAFYFDCKDEKQSLGSRWWITLPLALVIVFPLGLEFSVAGSWSLESFSPGARHLLGASLQVLFCWFMIFGLIGLFRRIFRHESRAMRYVSDSSYWLYLLHLPLIILGQWFVRDWPLSPFIKFPLICGVVTAVLLLSYQLFVRYTPIGTFLNGRRVRR